MEQKNKLPVNYLQNFTYDYKGNPINILPVNPK